MRQERDGIGPEMEQVLSLFLLLWRQKGREDMVYYTPQPGGYQPTQIPQTNYAPPVRGYTPEVPVLRTEIIRVNGENGAKALRLAPNCEALLLDTNAPIVWLVQTDGAGYKTETPFSITPYQAKPPVDVNSLENRIKRLEDLIYESHSSKAGAADPTTATE